MKAYPCRKERNYLPTLYEKIRRAERQERLQRVVNGVLVKVVQVLGATVASCLTALWAVPYAREARGCDALGSEYFLVLGVGVAVYWMLGRR